MDEINNLLKKFKFSEVAEKSIKEFSNWIFGIAIGICSLLIIDINKTNTSTCFDKYLFLILVGISFINCFIAGYVKYSIFIRHIRLSTKEGELMKIKFDYELHPENQNELNKKIDPIVNDWCNSYNSIKRIGWWMNIAIISTIATVLLSASYVIFSKI